jgi:hypothetical protein
MPYSKLSDINRALKGIHPPITLAQANWIADLADNEIKGAYAWPTAIKMFYRTHVPVGKGWVRKKSN